MPGAIDVDIDQLPPDEQRVVKYYNRETVQRMVRDLGSRNRHPPLCQGFCRLYNTDYCLFSEALPPGGHCHEFLINATTEAEFQSLLQRAAPKGVKVPSLPVGTFGYAPEGTFEGVGR